MHLNVQAVQLFTSVLLDSAGIDYHVVLAQNALHQCLTLTELQPELLYALIKQTSRIQSQPQATTKRSAAQVNRPVSHLFSPFISQAGRTWPACGPQDPTAARHVGLPICSVDISW